MIVAIVPAAGLSRRMGRPKPLLEIGGMTLIARVVRALRDGGADRVIVVAPQSGRAESAEIARRAAEAGAEVLVLGRETADMRESIEAGLARIEDFGAIEAVLLTPADVPGIGAGLVARVIRAGRDSAGCLARPRAGTKRGHPVYLPWAVARLIHDLPEGVGVNALVDDPGRKVIAVELDGGDALADVDTPGDYERWTIGRSPNSFG
ncbi:MAG TPA: NTP transferase domain-containing protein [Isosphaeraceae bacterium]|nr:NTP transferase domain-containing protein [Isosphaeraceae bacterium]